MTADEFRASPEMRTQLRDALNTPAVQQALAIGKSKNELVPIPLGLSGIDHARAGEERRVRALFVAELFELITAPPESAADRQPENFGTPHTIDDFDQTEPEHA